MNFSKPFTFIFEDPQWIKKILIIAAISLIPVIGWIFLLGWSLTVTRRIIRLETIALPELEFGDQITLGLKGWIVCLLYAIPVLVFTLPFWIVSIMPTAYDPQGGPSILALIVAFCVPLLISIYLLMVNLFLPAALSNLAARGTVSAGVNLRQLVGLIKAAPGAYLVDLAGVLIAGLIAPLGIVLCGVGLLVTSAYAAAVIAHFYAQAYREACQNLAYRPELF